MTATLDFGAMPPEINSASMYAGPGSGSMLVAAAGWAGLAAELRSQAASYSSVVSNLTSDGWRGPASASMAAAAAPYAAWMNATAALAEQAGHQATAAAAGYEAAFAATVPPPLIAANRTQLASLIATNVLGQNGPAIAVTEVHYAEMWAQDAAAMYDYAASSAAASQLAPLSGPQENTNVGALAGQSGAVAQAASASAGTGSQSLSQLVTAVPNTLQGLTSPASTMTSSASGLAGIWNLLTGGSSGNSALDSFWSEWGPNANIWNTIFSSGFYTPGNTLGAFTSLVGSQSSGPAGNTVGAAASNGPGVTAGGLASPLGGMGSGVSAGAGQAASMGPLSVPPSWSMAAAPATSPLASELDTGAVAAPPAAPGGVPGVTPAGAAAGARAGAATGIVDNRFLTRPPMVPSWAAVG